MIDLIYWAFFQLWWMRLSLQMLSIIENCNTLILRMLERKKYDATYTIATTIVVSFSGATVVSVLLGTEPNWLQSELILPLALVSCMAMTAGLHVEFAPRFKLLRTILVRLASCNSMCAAMQMAKIKLNRTVAMIALGTTSGALGSLLIAYEKCWWDPASRISTLNAKATFLVAVCYVILDQVIGAERAYFVAALMHILWKLLEEFGRPIDVFGITNRLFSFYNDFDKTKNEKTKKKI